MAHWHDHNPWAATIVYLPSLEEWADCHADLGQYCDRSAIGGGKHVLITVKSIIKDAKWNAMLSQNTNNLKLDPYILPQPDGCHSLGLRYGAKGSEYLSPECNYAKADMLIKKYRPTPLIKHGQNARNTA